jgi:hypothetical protein
MKQYTLAEKERIKSLISAQIEQSFLTNQSGAGTPFWMNVLFLLEKFNQGGNYYGTVAIKIMGTSCQNAKELEVTHKLIERYEDPPKDK